MTRIPTPGGSPSDIPSFAHAVDGPPSVGPTGLVAPSAGAQGHAPYGAAAHFAGTPPDPVLGAFTGGGAAHDGTGGLAGGHPDDRGVVAGTLVPPPGDGVVVGATAESSAASPAFGFPAPRPGAPTAQPLHMAGVLNPAALGGHPGYPSDPGPAFAAPGEASATAPLGGPHAFGSPGGPTVSYTVRVNGAMHVVDGVWIGESLLHVLRERLGLPGAKDGCGQGVCGTCTVLVDGAPAVSCMLPAATMGDREVTTIEGLADLGVPTAVRQALIAHGAVQCGFCVPGVVVSAHALLARIPQPDEATVRRALAGHPCRCAGPNRMVAAVCAVAAGEPAEPPASLFEPTGSGGAGSGTAGSGTDRTGPSRGDGTMSMGIISIPPGTAAGSAPAAAG
ncbi:2Fe-2S iron-sulfur cluster-binding protein [Streptomycetaceae bacterium NBC_01309]